MLQVQQHKGDSLMSYAGFNEVQKDVFVPVKTQSLMPNLPAGSYSVHQDRDGNTYFLRSDFTSDRIIDIPSAEFKGMVKEIDTFLAPDTQGKYKQYGFLYKRSFLLHGKPGMGKTVLVNRLAKDIISKGGVVLFNPNPSLLTTAFSVLNSLPSQPLTLVVFEEFDALVSDIDTEALMLSILDGEIQKDRIIYVATTNYFDKINKRLLRPGRFTSIIEVQAPNLESRIHFLNTKLNDMKESKAMAESTEGFSIDELKEAVLATKIYDMKMSDVKKRLKAARESIELASEVAVDNEIFNGAPLPNGGWVMTKSGTLAQTKKSW